MDATELAHSESIAKSEVITVDSLNPLLDDAKSMRSEQITTKVKPISS